MYNNSSNYVSGTELLPGTILRAERERFPMHRTLMCPGAHCYFIRPNNNNEISTLPGTYDAGVESNTCGTSVI